MGERLTSQWTATAELAYGHTGVRGRIGEVMLRKMLIDNNLPARDFERERVEQLRGIDIESNGHTIDVKSNLHDGVFFIEVDPAGWLFNPNKTSEIIVHIDIATSDVVWYTRAAARANFRVAPRLVKITADNFRPHFMSRSRDELFNLLRS
jgi:hypothetical protein